MVQFKNAPEDDDAYPSVIDRVSSPGGTVYHIDPAGGDDANSGRTEDQPWKTFHPVNRISLAPGDRVEVSPGCFDHSLSLSGCGTGENPIRVKLAAGRYDFDPAKARREAYQISNTNGDPEGLKAVGIHLAGTKHLRIAGAGAVIYARGKMMHLCIDGGENVTLDGLAFDYQRPTVSEFTVTAAGKDFAAFTIHKDSAYIIENGLILWQGEGWTETGGLGQELDPQTGCVHRLRDPLGGLRCMETGPCQIRARGEHRLQAGRIYQVRNPFRETCGAFIRNSRNITWRNLHFRFIHGMGIVSQFSENLTFEAVRIAPDPASGRTTAAWADCLQASGCRGRILVKDCLFSGAHDDAINIHGTHLRVVGTAPERREVKVRFMHDQTYGFNAFLPQDEVDFVRWDSLAPYASNRVAGSQLIDKKTIILHLEKPLPADIRENDVLENVTWTPEVEILGCKVMHIPTRGFLVTTRRPVRVEDNDFKATRMSAILVENDASGWYESGCVRDMLIRSNRFHGCGEPVIHINPRNSVPNPHVHQNIRIENNTFILRERVAIGASSTTGLRIVGNRIQTPERMENQDWLHTRDCAEVHALDNHLFTKG